MLKIPMIKILTFIMFSPFLSFYTAGNTIEIFNQHIVIPPKYKLEALASINTKHKAIVYRSGNFIRAPQNGKLEVIKIGKVSDYILESEKNKIEELGVIIKKTEYFNELKVPKTSFELKGSTYYYRLYFDKKLYISYFTSDLNDIDGKLISH